MTINLDAVTHNHTGVSFCHYCHYCHYFIRCNAAMISYYTMSIATSSVEYSIVSCRCSFHCIVLNLFKIVQVSEES